MRALPFAVAAILLSTLSVHADVKSELKSLVATVNSKLSSGQDSEQALAPELKQFDEILAKHSDEKTDAVAEVLFMKAMLYVQVFQDPAKASEIFAELQKKFPGTKAATAAEAATADLKKQEAALKIQAGLKAGAAFPDFSVKDLDGKPMSVSALKGKVVLIDFWATWCPPCVREIPNVIAAYKKYHSKGFDILGVSLDQDKAALAGFIKKNDMTWPQYFDGQGFDNALAAKYGIQSIPSTYLIDQKGNIIATNLRGEELETAVAKAIGEN
jgi:peroxiredoxin